MTAISRSAPGKLILSGEHAVVYHQPAIAVPVTRIASTTNVIATPLAPGGRVKVVAAQIGIETSLAELPETLPLRQSIYMIQEHLKLDHLPACEIRISSTIPVGSGLGSSASSSVSLVRALSEFLGFLLDDEEINLLAYEMEKLHHGNPSGIDNTVITYAQPIFFIRGQPIEFLKITRPLELIIADTGIRALTAEAVGQVKIRYQSEPQKFEKLFSEIGNITRQIKDHLSLGKASEIGPLLTENHHLLQVLGVSCPELDLLVQMALDSGAYGAKLSGGGLGGNMLALVDRTTAESVAEKLTAAGAVSVIHTSISP